MNERKDLDFERKHEEDLQRLRTLDFWMMIL